MSKLTEIAKKIPVLPSLYRVLRDKYAYYQLKLKGTEQVFTQIYSGNGWGGKESVSGAGSDVYQTRIITQELPVLFRDFGISTMLDIPCGDFHWMKNVDLSKLDYTGADIVDGLIESNRSQYSRDGLDFRKLNLIEDKLPKVDLVFCRDCLVHFSFEDLVKALDNICNSQSEYLLTTTFVGRKDNNDIATGQWRALNLEVAPLLLPQPLRIITEGCTESNGAYADKALGLWKIADIQASLTKHHT
jgi:hypothetical protein